MSDETGLESAEGTFDTAYVDSVYPADWESRRGEVQHPEQYHGVLEELANTARTAAEKATDIRHLYRIIAKQARRAIADERLPLAVRNELEEIVTKAKYDLQQTTTTRVIDLHDEEAVGHFIIRDVKYLGHVPLRLEDQVNEIEKIPLNSINDIDHIRERLEFPVPGAAFKGGVGRLIAKKYHLQEVLKGKREPSLTRQALQELIEADSKIDDFDVVLPEDCPDSRQVARDMGADPDGIEYMKWIGYPYLPQYMGTRDLASNMVLVDKNHLHIASFALHALDRGEAIPSMGRTPGVFGREIFTVKKKRHFAANTIYRMLKTVIDGKHKFFRIPQYNCDNIPLGIDDRYWNVMLRGWLNKPNTKELMTRAFFCAKQMGKTSAVKPVDFWQERIDAHPDFDYFSENTHDKIARWIVDRYITFLEKRLRRTFGIWSGEDRFKSEDDTVITVDPSLLSLPDYYTSELYKITHQLHTKGDSASSGRENSWTRANRFRQFGW